MRVADPSDPVQTALLVGIATQWLVDPELAPSAGDAAAAMRPLGRVGSLL